MKKIFLLGALVASTMAFASMESNSVLDTLKNGSVTVKGGLIYDNLTTPGTKFIDPALKNGENKTDYDAAKIKAKISDGAPVSIPSFGGGLEAEYSVPVYNINDDMSVLVAGGLQGGVVYGTQTGKVDVPKYDSNEDKFTETKVPLTDKRITTSVALFVAPKFEYKINDEIKVAGGVKLGLGGDFHTILGDNTLNDAITTANADYDKDGDKKKNPTVKKIGADTKNEKEQKYIAFAKARSESHTAGTFVLPMGITADVDYNNIVVSVDLGGKLLIPNEKDILSGNYTQDLSYTPAKETPKTDAKVTKVENSVKASPKFNFAAGLKVGYRFDLDKFMK